jgi:L-serine deaminase
MSDAKRDQSAFLHTAASGHTATLRARVDMPPATVKLKSLTPESLELAPPWGSVRAQGSNPYNAVGHRTATRTTAGAATRASAR